MKKIKLEVGEIYQKKGTLDVRVIHRVGRTYRKGVIFPSITYTDMGGIKVIMLRKSFYQWIRRNEFHHCLHGVQLIGHYDFETGKTRAVK